MELLVFGHGGAPVIVFPTSMGRFFDFEDRGMVGALAQPREGWVRWSADSVDARPVRLLGAAAERLERHRYERYILDEVVPAVRHHNSTRSDDHRLLVRGLPRREPRPSPGLSGDHRLSAFTT
jgi:esterase/lipase superfamily enzyme